MQLGLRNCRQHHIWSAAQITELSTKHRSKAWHFGQYVFRRTDIMVKANIIPVISLPRNSHNVTTVFANPSGTQNLFSLRKTTVYNSTVRRQPCNCKLKTYSSSCSENAYTSVSFAHEWSPAADKCRKLLTRFISVTIRFYDKDTGENLTNRAALWFACSPSKSVMRKTDLLRSLFFGFWSNEPECCQSSSASWY